MYSKEKQAFKLFYLNNAESYMLYFFTIYLYIKCKICILIEFSLFLFSAYLLSTHLHENGTNVTLHAWIVERKRAMFILYTHISHILVSVSSFFQKNTLRPHFTFPIHPSPFNGVVSGIKLVSNPNHRHTPCLLHRHHQCALVVVAVVNEEKKENKLWCCASGVECKMSR